MSGGGGHLSNLCRVCLKPPKSTEELDTMIIYDEEEELTYYDCLKIITHMDLAEGCGTPEKLCKICGLELQMAYDFYKKVEHAKRQVMQYMDSHRNSNPEDARVQSRLKAAVIPSKPICDDLPSTSDYLTDEHRTDDFEIDCEVLDEQHLDLDDYEAIEEEEIVAWRNRSDAESDQHSTSQQTGENRPADEQVSCTNGDANTEYLQTEMETYTTVEEERIEIDEAANHSKGNNKSHTAVERVRTAAARAGGPHVCEECGHECPTRSLLASHRHRKHRLKERAVLNRCTKCNRQFDTAKQLERHMNRPTCDVYPQFECEYCQKRLVGLSNYKVHLRFHQKEYPFVCHLCAKRFMMTNHLNAHIRAKHEHKRFLCEHPDCGKMFQTRHSLKTHMYSHSGRLPYKCDYCDRLYPSKGRLRWHIQKSHGIAHTLDELDLMSVENCISVKTEMKPISDLQSECGSDPSE